MAVIFAAAGGAIIGIAVTPPYSDYSDYHEHSDYSNYSDAAERERRRQEKIKQDIEQKAKEVNRYKINYINDYLEDVQLKSESGATVAINRVKQDGDRKMGRMQTTELQRETKDIREEIEAIDDLIKAIDNVLEES